MEASERKILQVLTEEAQYQIPPYQRPYSWGADNVSQLLDDVWIAYEDQDDEYFLGSLITIETKKDVMYEVVDGQQRLTTLNLILARLRDHVVDEAAKNKIGKHILPRNELTGETEKPRLSLRAKDQRFFERHILKSEAVSQATLNKIQKENDAPKIKILEAVEVIDKFFDGLDQRVLKLFANYLLSNVYVVFVTAGSFRSAYRLFNVLNARGVQLSNADLIKNALFGELGDNSGRSVELEERWIELEEAVGVDYMDDFLGHHRVVYTPAKAKLSLQEEYKPIIAEYKGNPFSLISDLIDSSQNYLRIHSIDVEGAMAKRALSSLHRVVFDDWIPALLAFMNNPQEKISESDFIVMLEKITIQNWVRRLAFTARQTVYFNLIKEIKSPSGSSDILSVFQQNSNDREFLDMINGNVYGKPFAKAVLLRLEQAFDDESVSKDFSGNITIEHILPQTMTEVYWTERFSDQEHQEHLHSLGNLVLLEGSKNYKAQNYGFDIKRSRYSSRNDKVSFDTTKEVVDLDEWNSSELKNRQSRMMERVKNIWSIEK